MSNLLADGNITAITAVSVSLNVASVAANTSAEQTFTLTGIDANKHILINVAKPTVSAGLGVVNARVSANNQIAITFSNSTAAAIDPAAESYVIMVGRIDRVNYADLPGTVKI